MMLQWNIGLYVYAGAWVCWKRVITAGWLEVRKVSAQYSANVLGTSSCCKDEKSGRNNCIVRDLSSPLNRL